VALPGVVTGVVVHREVVVAGKVRADRVRPGVVLALACGVQFMVTLDLSVVNVAIPSIQADLGLAQADLQWVVVTYGVVLGGTLLLGGRASDLLGRRRILVAGVALFAAASLGAGLSSTLAQLVASRGVQGLGAALAAPAALATIVGAFPEGAPRTKALGVFAAVSGAGASLGVIVGGLLTDGAGWEWVFLINVPVGLALLGLVLAYVPNAVPAERGPADVVGAVTVTAGLMAVVFGINQSVDHGWTAGRTLGPIAAGIVLLAVFALVERRAAAPLVPPTLVRRPTLARTVVVTLLVFGAFFATIFEGTLFMQQGLGYSPVETGLAWLAATASSLVVAGGIAPRFVGTFGAARSLVVGQLIVAAGLLHLAQADADASYWSDLFPGYLCFGVGLGFSIMATQVAAFLGVEEAEAGVAGGVVETAREVGGAIGTAIVATLAVARTDDLLAGGAVPATALAGGFERGLLVAAAWSVAAAVAAAVLLRPAERAAQTAAVAPVPDDVDTALPERAAS
jgi:EmrB/QacA subfamily drug resistance transporter